MTQYICIKNVDFSLPDDWLSVLIAQEQAFKLIGGNIFTLLLHSIS